MSKTFNRGRDVVRAAAFTAVLLAGGLALGHHPIMEQRDLQGPGDAMLFEDLTSSYAAYSNLDRPGDVDWYRFEITAPATVNVVFLVPHRPEYIDFYPAYAVIGPGLPAPATELPFALPEGAGAEVMGKAAGPERGSFFEPFSFTRYYRGVENFDRELTAPGIYYIAVWHPAGETGAYTLCFGRGEKWKLSDVPETIKSMLLIQSGKWMVERKGPPSE